MLNKLHLTQNNNIICAGVLNLLSNLKLEYYGGNTVFENTIRKIFELKETYNLTDIGRITNPRAKQYTFWKKHPSGLLQSCLDCFFFISGNIQEFLWDTEKISAILTSF